MIVELNECQQKKAHNGKLKKKLNRPKENK